MSVATTASHLAHEKRLLRLQDQFARVNLLIVDELGYGPLSQTRSELLFDVFSQRYENGATIVTSNRPFQEGTTVFASERLTGALLDRITHHVHNFRAMSGADPGLAVERWQDTEPECRFFYVSWIGARGLDGPRHAPRLRCWYEVVIGTETGRRTVLREEGLRGGDERTTSRAIGR